MMRRICLAVGLGVCLVAFVMAASTASSELAPAQAWSMQHQTVALHDSGPPDAASGLPSCPVTTTVSPMWWDTPPQAGSVIVLPSGQQIIQPGPEDIVRVIILLEGEPVSGFKSRLRPQGGHLSEVQQDEVRGYVREVQESHQRVLLQIEAQGITLELRREYSYVLNGLAGSIRMADIERIAAVPEVQAVYPDYEVHALLEESVPLIGADQVWTMLDPYGQPVTGQGIRIAVLDTGIDYNHPDLGGGFGSGYRVVGGYDFVNDDGDPMDDNFHGTHCAGIVAANGTVKGVAPDATLYAYKVLGADGRGSDSDAIAGIERALDPDGDPGTDDAVDIMTMSFGGGGGPDEPLAQAVDAAVDEGVVAAVAAGNEGPGYGSVLSPGVARKAFTVGASDKADDMADLSSRGPVAEMFALIKPDIVAPGVSIQSTEPDATHGYRSGTSMSTPHIAGCAALVKQLHPSWSPEMIQASLMNTSRDLATDVFTQGAGRVQVDDAVLAPAVLVPGSVGFGLVDPEQPLWTQSTTLELHNVSTSEQEYSLQVSGDLPDGVTTQLNPNRVTLGPGESSTVAFTIIVDNAVTPYQDQPPCSYQGQVIARPGQPGQANVQASAEGLAVPFAFLKGHSLSIAFDVAPSIVIVHNGRTQWTTYSPSALLTLRLPEGTYDVWVLYSDVAWVIREGVAVSGVTRLNVNRSEAAHNITLAPRDQNGEPISSGYRSFVQRLQHMPSGQKFDLIWRFATTLSRHFSDMSTDYVWEWRTIAVWQGALYQFYDRMIGVDSDFTYQNAPEDLWHVEHYCHPPPASSELHLRYYLPYG